MASRTTFTGIVRSNGGDSKRETYAGSVQLAAQFYFLPTAAAGTDVQVSATDTRKVVLPKNAIVTGITFNPDATGGTNPTVDMGYTDFDGGTNLGETLCTLLRNPRYLGFARGALIISISDGLEVGKSDALLEATRKLYSLAFAHIWLTPLAKTEDFSPQTEALMRIEPFIDEFGSALSISHICAHLLGAPVPKEVA